MSTYRAPAPAELAANPTRSIAVRLWVGTVVALAATMLLDSVGALRGPDLLAPIGPAAEAQTAILLGVAVVVVSNLVRQARSAC